MPYTELLHLIARQDGGSGTSAGADGGAVSAEADDPCGVSPTDKLGLRVSGVDKRETC